MGFFCLFLLMILSFFIVNVSVDAAASRCRRYYLLLPLTRCYEAAYSQVYPFLGPDVDWSISGNSCDLKRTKLSMFSLLVSLLLTLCFDYVMGIIYKSVFNFYVESLSSRSMPHSWLLLSPQDRNGIHANHECGFVLPRRRPILRRNLKRFVQKDKTGREED